MEAAAAWVYVSMHAGVKVDRQQLYRFKHACSQASRQAGREAGSIRKGSSRQAAAAGVANMAQELCM